MTQLGISEAKDSRRARRSSHPASALRMIAPAILVVISTLSSAAVDGCKVLLCLAAPSWNSIAECVPTIRQLQHDLARGRPFPSCSMAGNGNSASHAWTTAPSSCPPQYTHVIDGESGPIYSCDYLGVVTVSINGAPFTRTWWRTGDESVTEFTSAAKAQLGTWDRKFDDDYATWLSSLPLPAPPCPSC